MHASAVPRQFRLSTARRSRGPCPAHHPLRPRRFHPLRAWPTPSPSPWNSDQPAQRRYVVACAPPRPPSPPRSLQRSPRSLPTRGSAVSSDKLAARVADRDLAVALHDRNLNVLRPRLNHLQQRLDCQLDGVCPVEVLRVILLQELPDRLGRSPDRTCLPSALLPREISS